MPKEIERKFLVKDNSWNVDGEKFNIRQGYISASVDSSVRIRVKDKEAWITIKGPTMNSTRAEYEYSIPRQHAIEMLNTLCPPPHVQKTRHIVIHQGHRWEVDVFEGENKGLVLAELELTHPDESFERPKWLGKEVTDDPRYINARLSVNPFGTWTD